MRRPPLPLVAITAVLAIFSLVPLGYIVWATVDVGLTTGLELVLRERVLRLLGSTAALVATAVPLCVVIGVGAAWVVERTDIPGRRLWAILLAAPLAVPAFVASYAWLGLVPSIGGLGGGTLIAVCAYFPLVYLPSAAALRRMDPGLEEAARSLGQSPFGVTVRVVLPQLRLAASGGALLVGLHLLAEYGAFAMIRFDTFTTAIVEQYQSTFTSQAGSMIAGVLVLACLVLLAGESAARGSARYSRIGSGSARRPQPIRLGVWTAPVSVALAGVVAASVGVPLVVVIKWLARGGAQVWAQPEIASSLGETLGLSLAGALACVLCALPVAWLTVRYGGPLARLVEGTYYLSSALPGIVVALALTTIAIRVVPQLYQTGVLVTAAYVLLFVPRAIVSVRAGLAQAPERHEEAARSLGAPPLVAIVTVTLRAMVPALLAAVAMVFLAAANELTATLLLAPTGTTTLATRFWSLGLDLNYVDASPYALLLIVLSAPMTYLLLRQAAMEAR